MNAFAQIEINESGAEPFTPENLIYKYFLGEGVKVLNVKYDGPTMSVGYFDKGKNSFGIETGIVLTTGRVKTTQNGSQFLYGIDAIGKDQADNNNGSTIFDADAILMTKEAPQNLVKYTITFQPSSDTLRFRYVFASEEYPEFACREYNDLFGFFISGPGINGPFQNKGINIAKIPNTDKSVTINNIHPEYKPNKCSAAFADMYHTNPAAQPVFDGYLDVFTAAVPVIPCETYTIKLVIADVGDKRMDSGVFLEAKSFGTNALKVETTNAVAVEGCADAKLTFKLSQKKAADYVIPLTIVGGDAKSGVDFKAIPTSVVIPKGEMKTSFLLEAIKDQLKEDFETVGIEYAVNSCKKDTIWLSIKDNTLQAPELGADKSICESSVTSLDASVVLEPLKEKKFSYNTPIDIATMGLGVTDPPTAADIKVSGVAPSQLREGAIESVCLNITHDRAEDLDVFLFAPNGKFIELTSDNGAKGKHYNSTCFSPKATKSITSGSTPFSGNYQPEGRWDDLFNEGENPINGIWRLQVIDDQSGMKGKLNSWDITFKPPYSLAYQWTPSDGLSCATCAVTNAKPSKSTQYKVEITDTYGCKVRDSIKILVTNEIPAPSVTCQNVTANSITFAWQSAIANIQNFEISINGAAWITPKSAFSHTVENLGLGEKIQLQVRAKGSSGCNGGGAKIGTAECKTPDCFPPTLTLKSLTDESCHGKKDASVTLLSDGKNTTYKLDNQQNKSGIFTNLSAGKYTAIVTENKGCTATLNLEIKSPNPIIATAIVKDAPCFGNKSASIALKTSGGIAPYTFTWDNGKKDSVLQNLSAGLYGVVIFDKNGCSIKQQFTIKELANMSLTADIQAVGCYGEASGAIDLKVAGGTAPLSYKWSNQTTNAAAAKLKAGIYHVTVTDAAGCLAQQSFTLVSPESPMFITLSQSSTICFGEKGYASSFVTGGTPPYSYKWNNGEIMSELKEITAGLYKVTISDKNNCVRIDSAKIVSTEEIKVESTSKDAACFNGLDGSASIMKVFNGATPVALNEMSYRWNTGFTGTEATNLKGGTTYTVTVTNRLGCAFVKKFAIQQPKEIGVSIQNVSDAKCFDSADGSATVSAFGGNAPYQYTWNEAANKQTTANATALKSGLYDVFIKDAKGCQTQTTVTINAPKKLKISFTPTNVACKDGASGKLETFILGGVAPYQYAWSNGEKTPSIEHLKVGNYSLTLTDKNTCSLVQNMKLLEPEELKAKVETTDVTCANGRDGKIRVFAQGGTSPYKYSIDGKLFNGVATIFGLKSAYYNVYVKDIRGCISSNNDVYLEEPEPIKIELGQDTTIKYGDTIILKLDSYFIPSQGFKYDWKTDYNKFMNCKDCPSPMIFPTNTATYYLKVTNTDGCTAEDKITVKVNYAPVVDVPTGFSPNGDANNDVLLIHGDSNIKVKYFNIYGRDGAMIYAVEDFYINDAKMGWDGTHRNQKMPVGTYIWGMEVEYANGTTETLKGNVTLLR